MQVDSKAFYERLKKYRNILFLCHKNADVDSLGGAYALQRVFGGHIGVYDSPGTMAAMLCERLNIHLVISPMLNAYDIVVVVDTSTMVQTGYGSIGTYAIIDHHTPGDMIDGCQFALSRVASSTGELVYSIYSDNGLMMDADTAFVMVLAIVTDTGHFRYANYHVFEIVSRILQQGGIRYASVAEFLSQVPVDLSCRIATIKAASRLTLHRVGELLIVETTVGSFGAQAATSLISLGADVAFVGSDKDGERRISGRVRRGVDLDLSRLLQELGKKFNGSGGGHAAAAGVVIRGDLDQALQECVDMAVAELSRQGGNK
ncbi:MAG TPA: DHH family phosphoesterase [Methanocella sp.]|nr:DHH family phosphoesterase [Methanocella sp.]